MLTKVMLLQAEASLRCYINPEPIEIIANLCNMSIQDAQAMRDRQDAEAAKLGRTANSLQARVDYWRGI